MPPQNHTDAFIKAAQYIVRLTAQQDLLGELGKIIVSYFRAEWVVFASVGPHGHAELRSSTVPDEDFSLALVERSEETIRDVLDTGFLASQRMGLSPAYSVAFLPVGDGNAGRAVAIIGHDAAHPPSQELLNLYLALTGIAGSTMGRIATERELRSHQLHLEDLVRERTAALETSKEKLEMEIAERKLAQEQVQEQREWLRVTLASIGDAVMATDGLGRITFMNVVAETLTGWTLDEASMRPAAEVFNIVNEQTRKTADNPVARVLHEGTIVGLANHTILINKDGVAIPIDDSAAPIRGRDGTIMGAVLVFRDISQRRLGENALRDSEEKLRLFIEHAPAAVAMFDREMRYVAVSRRWLADYGLVSENIVGKSHYEVFPDLPERWKEVHRRCLAGAREKCEDDPFPRMDGKIDWVSWEILPWHEYNGDIGGLIMLTEVVTARKEAENALRQARDELEIRVEERTAELQHAYESLMEETRKKEEIEAQLRQAQKMEALGTLSGGIAHDFNNILAAIIGFTELVAGHVEKGSRDEQHLARVMQASIRGRELVQQLLAFSRKTEAEKRPLLLGPLVVETTKFLRATTPATISIRVDAGSEKGLVLADPTQMRQILMNLCTNAVFAMRERGGVLDVELSDFNVSPSCQSDDGMEPGAYIRLVVRDTGTGIPSDIIDRIFDPFFTTKKVGEGTGLGLSVVHGIVKQSNGYIFAESEPGRGSTFTVYLPKIVGDAETPVTGDDALPTGSERILFVDDEEALVEIGEDILAELGYEATSRMNGREALSLLKEDPSRFDLVITDVTMPEMTGVELAKEVLALRPAMPVILCTGHSHLVDADRAKAAGIRAFVMKPLTKREIARTIRQVLDGETYRTLPSGNP